MKRLWLLLLLLGAGARADVLQGGGVGGPNTYVPPSPPTGLRALGDLDITGSRLDIGGAGAGCTDSCPDWLHTGVEAQAGNGNLWGEPLDTSGWTVDTTTLAACAGTDDRTLVQNAVTNAAAQTVLVIPSATVCKIPDEGNYLRIARSEIVIRGADRATSILDLGNDTDDTGNALVCNNGTSKETRLGVCGTGPIGSTTTLSSGYTRGSLNLVASSSTHGLIAGDYAVVWSVCPSTGAGAPGRCNGIHQNYGSVVERQIVHIASTAGTAIVLEEPLNIDFTAGSGPRIQKLSMLHSVGIENLTIDKGSDTFAADAGDGTPGSLVMQYVRSSWVKNVTFTGNYRGFWYFSDSAWLTFNGNEFGDMACEGAATCDFAGHYGITWSDGSTAIRFENNWIHDEWLWAKLDQGANLGVIAYNYIDGTNDCATGTANHGLLFHGAFPTDFLVEGNDSACRFTIDNFWGVEGERITFHRNRLRANDAHGALRVHEDNDCTNAANPNIVDGPLNFLNNTVYGFTQMPFCGEYGDDTSGACDKFDADTCVPDSWFEFNIARDGRSLTNDPDGNLGFTPSATTSICDAAAGDCTEAPTDQWGDNWEGISAPNAALQAASLPGSLYLEATPSWWCSQAGIFGSSVGADVDDFGGTLDTLPAQLLAAGTPCNVTQAFSPVCPTGLCDLHVPANRVSEYRFAAEAEANYLAAQAWPERDVTCGADPCASGKTSIRTMPGGVDAPTCGTLVSTSNASSTMQCFLNNAPDNTVLFVPGNGGTPRYAMSSGWTFQRDNIAVRGAGITQTVFERTTSGRTGYGSSGNPCFQSSSGAMHVQFCNSGAEGASVNWTAGYSVGTTTVTLADTSSFTVGGWAVVTMNSDINCSLIQRTTASGPPYSHAFWHIARVTAKTGSTITLDEPLRLDYAASGCTGQVALPWVPRTNVGIENARFTTTTSIPVGGGSTDIKFQSLILEEAAETWIVGVQTDRIYDQWITTGNSARNLIQGNYFTDQSSLIQFSTEGVHFKGGAIDNTFENNIVEFRRAGSKIEGSEGTIAGYNYYVSQSGTAERCIFNHGHYARTSLFEGNDCDNELLVADQYWGESGPHHTAYRNRARLTSCPGAISDTDSGITFDQSESGTVGNTTAYCGNLPCVAVIYAAEEANVIANISWQISEAPYQTSEGCDPPHRNDGVDKMVHNGWFERNQIISTNASIAFPINGTVSNRSCGTALGDACPGTNEFGTGPHSEALTGLFPNSFYRDRSTPPIWWCQEACSWDIYGIGAFGDVAPSNYCELPAQLRYEGKPCTGF